MKPQETLYVDGLNPDSLVVDGLQKQISLKLPLAISHLLDLKVARVDAGLAELGQERTSRSEMTAMLITMACREDAEKLSLEDRIIRYRHMTVGELLGG
jgi:hypothetical protein